MFKNTRILPVLPNDKLAEHLCSAASSVTVGYLGRIAYVTALVGLFTATTGWAADQSSLFSDGYFWYRQGRLDAAREKWEAGLRLEPGNQELRSALKELKHFDPDRIDTNRLEEARRLAAQGRYQDAISSYRQAFGGEPPTSYYAREYYETLAGIDARWQEAANRLKALAATYPSNRNLELAYAKVLSYREDSRREAIHRLAAMANEPGLDEGQRKQAHEAWRKALLWLNASVDDKPLYQAYLQRDPDPAVQETLNNIGLAKGETADAYALLEAGQYREARKKFRETLAIDPENVDAIAGLGIIELRKKRFSKAARLLGEAVRRSPDKKTALGSALRDARYWALVRRSRVAFQRHKFDKALKLARKVDQSRPGRVEGKLLEAAIASAEGKHRSAVALYRAVLKKSRHNRIAQNGVVQNLIALHDEDAARQSIKSFGLPEKAYQQALKRLRVEDLRRTAMFLDDPRQALDQLHDALDLDPENPWVRLDMARLLHRMGREDEAVSLFENLHKASPTLYSVDYAQALYHEENGQWSAGLAAIGRIPEAAMTPEQRVLKRHLWAFNEERRALDMVAAGRQEEAIRIAQRLKAASRLSDPQTTLAYAELIAQMGDQREALRIGRQVVDPVFSPDIETSIRFGNLLLLTGERDELKRLLDRIETHRFEQLSQRQTKSINQLRDGARLQQADVYRYTGDYPAALEVLSHPALVAENQQKFDMARAGIQLQAGQAERAVHQYRALVNADRTNESAWAGLVSASLAMNDFEQAQQDVRQGLHAVPGSPELLALRARIHEARGEYSAAYWDAESALSMSGGGSAEHSTDAGRPQGGSWRQGARALKMRLDAQSSSYFSIGAGYRNRGDKGLDKVTEYVMPVQINYRLQNRNQVGAEIRQVILDGPNALTGVEKKSRDYNVAFFGGFPIYLANPENFHPTLDPDGLGFNLFFDSDHLHADIGSKPSGFVGDSLVGDLTWRKQTFDRAYSVGYSQHAVKESVLSYAGARDPQFGGSWGGVIRSGIDLGYSQQMTSSLGYYTQLGLFNLSGKNVKGNDEKNFLLGGYWQLKHGSEESLTVGLGLQYRKFSRNLRFFTLGHGGYFSPQRYLSLFVPIGYLHRQGRLSYRVNLDLGAFDLEESATAVFPNDAALQQRWQELAASRNKLEPLYDGRQDSGFLYNLHSEIDYQLNRQFLLGGWLEANNASDFKEVTAGIALKYYFSPLEDGQGSRLGDTRGFKVVW